VELTAPQPDASRTVQVTLASEAPVTVAEKVVDWEAITEAELGLTLTATTGAAVTVTTALPEIEGSATDFATT
jgi:hypothetical protein